MVGYPLAKSTENALLFLENVMNPPHGEPDKGIPLGLLQRCEGIAFVTILKAGVGIIGGNVGGGCVLAKVPDESDPRGWRWSGPSSVVCAGLSGGFTFGAERVESLILLNTKSAVKGFMGDDQITFGGNLSIAAGPVGREVEAHIGVSDQKELTGAYSYSRTQGAMISATLEGAYVTASKDANNTFYGTEDATPAKILSGELEPPEEARALISKLDEVCTMKQAVTPEVTAKVSETISE